MPSQAPFNTAVPKASYSAVPLYSCRAGISLPCPIQHFSFCTASSADGIRRPFTTEQRRNGPIAPLGSLRGVTLGPTCAACIAASVCSFVPRQRRPRDCTCSAQNSHRSISLAMYTAMWSVPRPGWRALAPLSSRRGILQYASRVWPTVRPIACSIVLAMPSMLNGFGNIFSITPEPVSSQDPSGAAETPR